MAHVDLLVQSEQLPDGAKVRYEVLADGVYALHTFSNAQLVFIPSDGDGNGDENPPQELLTDEITGALATMSVEHHEVHVGDMFRVDAVVDAASLVIAFRTGARYCHVMAGFRSESAAHFDMIEAPTWNAGTGMRKKLYNRNRTGGSTATIQDNVTGAFVAAEFVIVDPTNLAGGTITRSVYTWSDKKHTSESRAAEEFVLRVNTNYAYRLVSDDGVKGLQIILSWYEEATN